MIGVVVQDHGSRSGPLKPGGKTSAAKARGRRLGVHVKLQGDTRGLEGGLVGEVPTVRQSHCAMPTLCKIPDIRGGYRSQDISVKRVGHRGDARSLQRGMGGGGGAKRLSLPRL